MIWGSKWDTNYKWSASNPDNRSLYMITWIWLWERKYFAIYKSDIAGRNEPSPKCYAGSRLHKSYVWGWQIFSIVLECKLLIWLFKKEACMFFEVFPHISVGKEFTCNAGDEGSIPGSGRSSGEEMATHSSILAWRIPWTEEPGRLQSMGLQKSDMT